MCSLVDSSGLVDVVVAGGKYNFRIAFAKLHTKKVIAEPGHEPVKQHGAGQLHRLGTLATKSAFSVFELTAPFAFRISSHFVASCRNSNLEPFAFRISLDFLLWSARPWHSGGYPVIVIELVLIILLTILLQSDSNVCEELGG